MATLLYRVGAFAARFHILVIVGWVIVLGLAVGGAQLLGGTLVSSFSIPGTQSQNALDMLEQRFPQASGAASKVIYVAPQGQQITAFESQIDDSIDQLKTLDHVSMVAGPWDKDADAQIASDGSMAYANVQYDVPSTSLTEHDTDAIISAGDVASTDGVTVGFAGVTDPPEAGVDYTEAIGLVVAFVVLVITFGSLLAAGMPLVTALIGVGLASMSITIASGFATISSTAPLLATMLGLAVGIDYALFIVSRHRSQLARGVPVRESIAMAVATAGSAVVFAGLTVIIALLGLAVVQIPFLTVMGIGAAIAVVCAVIVAVTLLPALLALFGRLLIPKPTSRAARRELAGPGGRPTLARRWVRLVTARPIITVVATVVGLLILAVPATQMRLTLPDAGYNPPGSESRQGYDLLSQGFGPGFNGPLLVTADISKTLDISKALTALHDEFAGLPDVASVSQAIPNATADMAIVSIIPDSSPDSEQTVQLVQSIRDRAGAFEDANGFPYQVTGQTALGIDVSQRLSDALLPFALVVVGLCIVLLTIVFRSLAVPLSATVGYLLSVVASFGVTTAIFEWGWLADALTVAKVGPVISFMPILVMAVLFGLAMDYEVFLVSKMREEFVEHGDAHRAVVDGFSGAARVVTAAACIMFAVFASFVPGGNAILQPIALALAVGVFLDAFVVRMTLIPAVMMLLGRLAWALPAPLARRLPDVDLEGERVRHMLAAAAWRPAGAGAAAGAAGTSAPAGEGRVEREGADEEAPDGIDVLLGDEAGPEPIAHDQPDFVIALEDAVVVGSGAGPLTVTAGPGDVVVVTGPAGTDPLAVAAALTGRQHVESGHAVVLGHPLPYSASRLRREAALLLPESGDAARPGRETDVLSAVPRRAALVAVDLTGPAGSGSGPDLAAIDRAVSLATTVVVATRADDADRWSVPGREVRVLHLSPPPSSSPQIRPAPPGEGRAQDRIGSDDSREEVTA
ncbi:MMPL family transporter [Cnuibacter physcomitrellae]|uniref:MMPL family transporter n=1 Tax=Cnuibacter physcomitrellae TaxID=1619308 RepID=UPI002175AF9B|nr:MMPL family transporter [Cnuibacter physcomitrellae]MCS5497571.1 MMPL family transporter [Cnuibacter physcomitrellae]